MHLMFNCCACVTEGFKRFLHNMGQLSLKQSVAQVAMRDYTQTPDTCLEHIDQRAGYQM